MRRRRPRSKMQTGRGAETQTREAGESRCAGRVRDAWRNRAPLPLPLRRWGRECTKVRNAGEFSRTSSNSVCFFHVQHVSFISFLSVHALCDLCCLGDYSFGCDHMFRLYANASGCAVGWQTFCALSRHFVFAYSQRYLPRPHEYLYVVHGSIAISVYFLWKKAQKRKCCGWVGGINTYATTQPPMLVDKRASPAAPGVNFLVSEGTAPPRGANGPPGPA